MVNLKEIPDSELGHMLDTTNAYIRKLNEEVARREALDTTEASLDGLLVRYLQASGVRPGDEWQGPSSAVEAFPAAWTVTHDGALWKSAVSGNMDEPGDGDAWDRVGDDPKSPSTPGESLLVNEDVLLADHDAGPDGEEWVDEDG